MEKATSTSPIIKNGKKLTRRFLGNLFPKTCIEGKELKAYLKGQNKYSYKKNDFGDPMYYPVRQEYFYQ